MKLLRFTSINLSPTFNLPSLYTALSGKIFVIKIPLSFKSSGFIKIPSLPPWILIPSFSLIPLLMTISCYQVSNSLSDLNLKTFKPGGGGSWTTSSTISLLAWRICKIASSCVALETSWPFMETIRSPISNLPQALAAPVGEIYEIPDYRK